MKHIKKYTAIIGLLLFVISLNAQNNYKIFRENQESVHQLGIDKFYFVHHTFADSFFMTDLYKQLSYDEMAQILQHVYDGVTKDEKVNIEFEIEEPSDAKLAYFFNNHEKNGETFIMLTNFSNASRKFEPQPDPKDQLARWYFIRGDKLVYRKDLYTEERELEKKNGEKIELVDFYLFDDNKENDKLIKPLIDELLSPDEKGTNKLYGYLFLSEYHLLNGNFEKSEEAIEKMKKLYDESKEIPRTFSLIVNMGKAEHEILKRMR